MRCPECGKENPAEAAQCAFCGYPLKPPPRRRTSLLAVASFCLALLCIPVAVLLDTMTETGWEVVVFPAMALASVLFGITARVQIGRHPDRLRGALLARVGLIIGGAYVLLYVGFGLLIRSAERWKVERWTGLTCLDHMHPLLETMQMYMADTNNTFPPAATWCDALRTKNRMEGEFDVYVFDNAFICPRALDLRYGYGYAFNAALEGVRYDTLEDPEHTIVIFESDAGWNAAGGPELLPQEPRHTLAGYTFFDDENKPADRRVRDDNMLNRERGDHYGLASGHVGWYSREEASDLHWQPVLKEGSESP